MPETEIPALETANDVKAKEYDRVLRLIRDREGTITRLLAGRSSGYRHDEVGALFAAFDTLIDAPYAPGRKRP